MGDSDACCKTCEQFGGKEADPVEREEMSGPPSRFKVLVSNGTVYVPTKPEMIIGRGTQADIPLRDGNISRRQARLVFRDDGVYIQDLESTCGTYVDGRRVDTAKLGVGAVVQFADYTLRVIER